MVRRDAARNRDRLVAAAREVFAASGFDATLDDVAAHAGLGVGTAYRHFRNKHELAAEVLADATRSLVDDAERAAAIEDPWAAIVAFFDATATRQAADRALYQALQGRGATADEERLWPAIVAAVTALFDRAKQAGVLRADVGPEDAAPIVAMVGALAGTPYGRRYLELLLDGLRATERPPLDPIRPALRTFDDMTAVTTRRSPAPER